MKQVEKTAYQFEKYSHLDRWASYYYQLKEVLDLNPASVLEIGVGDKVFGEYIKNNTSIAYTDMDIAVDLHPDIVGSVEAIPINSDSFDIVCAFEVLEHQPFENFETSLVELKRVSKRYVVVSLPCFGPPIKVSFKIPFLPEVKIAVKIPFAKRHIFNGQHYWEIGKSGYSVGKIRKIFDKHYNILKEFVPFENQYHRFYVLEKRV